MNQIEIIERLQEEFPGKRIVSIPPENPRQIICEVGEGESVAYIDASQSHYHSQSTEAFTVEEGTLSLLVAGKHRTLVEGETYIVAPGKVHSAIGQGTRVRINSSPARNEEDKIFFPRRV